MYKELSQTTSGELGMISARTVDNKDWIRRGYCGGYEGSTQCLQLLQPHGLLKINLVLLHW